MNYKRHYFWMNGAGIIGTCIGGLVWFMDASVRMLGTSVAKMPFESISWRMYVYPLIGGALAWLLVRFPLMARCETCQTRLRFYRMGSPRYICPKCHAQFAVGAPVENEQETPAAQQPQTTGLARLRQKLYPLADNGSATWKVALGVLGFMALVGACVPVQSLEVEVMGIQIKNAALAAHISWAVWAILNLYLLIGISWSLIDPEDQPTAALARGRRWLFMALGILCVVISLLTPILRSH
ncbi:MAG: hypothetical protein NTY53_10165 [Kiritimatiellaeota bacterium]|nr:hypothetical protein [Kiritimatiellota bacterium]